jgi:hypothetical protein
LVVDGALPNGGAVGSCQNRSTLLYGGFIHGLHRTQGDPPDSQGEGPTGDVAKKERRMNAHELRDKTPDELRDQLVQLKKEAFNLRFQAARFAATLRVCRPS